MICVTFYSFVVNYGQWVFSLVVITAVASIIITAIKNSITPMPGSSAAVRLMTKEAQKIMEDETIVEAGSGWGFAALHLARALPRCRIVGLENSPVPYMFSRLLQVVFRNSNLKFIKKDIFIYNYADVDMIFCYLCPKAMERLEIIYNDSFNGIKYVISNTFAFPGVKAGTILKADDLYQSPVYIYCKKIMPASEHQQ